MPFHVGTVACCILLIFSMTLAPNIARTQERAESSDLTWCRSAAAHLAPVDVETCVYRMERANNERERNSIREALKSLEQAPKPTGASSAPSAAPNSEGVPNPHH